MPRTIKVISTQVSRPQTVQKGGMTPLAMMALSIAPMLLEPILKPLIGRFTGNGARLAGQGKKKRYARR